MNSEREGFRAYLVNSDGSSGALIRFPTTPETYAETLRFIGLEADAPTRWQGFYCPEQPLIGDLISSDAHVDELHYLAVRFLALDDMDKYISILERANPTMQPLPIAELITHTKDLPAYRFMRSVESDQELGTEILDYEMDAFWDVLSALSASNKTPQLIVVDALYEAIEQLDAEQIGREIRE